MALEFANMCSTQVSAACCSPETACHQMHYMCCKVSDTEWLTNSLTSVMLQGDGASDCQRGDLAGGMQQVGHQQILNRCGQASVAHECGLLPLLLT